VLVSQRQTTQEVISGTGEDSNRVLIDLKVEMIFKKKFFFDSLDYRANSLQKCVPMPTY